MGHRLRLGQNSGTIGFVQRALAHDHHGRAFSLDCVWQTTFVHGLQIGAAGAAFNDRIGQIDLRTNTRDCGTLRPCLADTRVQHGCFHNRIRSDQQEVFCLIDLFNRGITGISSTVAHRQFGPVCSAFHNTALPFDQLFQAVSGLGRGQITNQTGQFGCPFDRFRGLGQRLTPACGPQLAIFADVWTVQTLAAQTIPDKTGFVGNPFLVHTVMVTRQEPHDFAPLGVDANIRAQRVHHIDAFRLGQLPRTRGKGIRFRHQCAHRAQIDDVALQVRIQRFAQIGRDLGILAAPGLAHLGDASHFGGKAHAACARNATRHMRFDERSEVQIINRALGFAKA